MEFAWNQHHTVSLEKKNKNIMLIGYAPSRRLATFTALPTRFAPGD